MLAASTASAPPMRMPSARCSQRADAARGDHRHADRVADRARQRQVEAAAWCRRGPCWSAGSRRRRARAISRAHSTASSPVLRAPAVGVDVPAGRVRRSSPCAAWRRSRRRCTARRTCADASRDQLRVGDRGRVEADLVGAGIEQPAHVVHRAHAAADRQRDEDLRRHRLDDVQDQVAPVAGGGDVEEGQFVGALLVVARARSRPGRRRRAARRS